VDLTPYTTAAIPKEDRRGLATEFFRENFTYLLTTNIAIIELAPTSA
jgi:hypothetical protein